MNKQAYERLVGLAIQKRAGFMDGFNQGAGQYAGGPSNFMNSVGDAVNKGMTAAGNIVGKGINQVGTAIDSAPAAWDTVKNYGQAAANNANHAVRNFGARVNASGRMLRDTASEYGQAAARNVSTAARSYAENARRGVQTLGEYGQAALTNAGTAFRRAGAAARGLWGGIKSGFRAAGRYYR